MFIEVREMVDWRLSTDRRYFKVIGSDAATYLIRRETLAWQWELVLDQSAERIFLGTCESGES